MTRRTGTRKTCDAPRRNICFIAVSGAEPAVSRGMPTIRTQRCRFWVSKQVKRANPVQKDLLSKVRKRRYFHTHRSEH